MKETYISPEYKKQLEDLGDTLMEAWRERNSQSLGQLALFEVVSDVRED